MGVNAHVSVTPSAVMTAADLSLSVFICVHRAIFTYDGFTNKLKLADSGGKNDHHLISVRWSHAVRTFKLSPPP